MTIQKFTQLTAWKESHKLVLLTYQTTNRFPAKEKFVLVPQMNRCVISISSNIAEGFTRQGNKEKIQFYYMAKASLTELENQLIIANDLGYVSKDNFQLLTKQFELVGKLITGLIRSIKSR